MVVVQRQLKMFVAFQGKLHHASVVRRTCKNKSGGLQCADVKKSLQSFKTIGCDDAFKLTNEGAEIVEIHDNLDCTRTIRCFRLVSPQEN